MSFFQNVGIIVLVLSMLGCGRRQESVMQSRSMEPYIMSGEKVIIDAAAYEAAKPELGHVVAFWSPDEKGAMYIFRVAGIPNDDISWKESGVHVNGKQCSPPQGGVYTVPEDKIGLSLKLGEDEYFLLGDNVELARDSRIFGAIKKGAIVGKVEKLQEP